MALFRLMHLYRPWLQFHQFHPLFQNPLSFQYRLLRPWFQCRQSHLLFHFHPSLQSHPLFHFRPSLQCHLSLRFRLLLQCRPFHLLHLTVLADLVGQSGLSDLSDHQIQ